MPLEIYLILIIPIFFTIATICHSILTFINLNSLELSISNGTLIKKTKFKKEELNLNEIASIKTVSFHPERNYFSFEQYLVMIFKNPLYMIALEIKDDKGKAIFLPETLFNVKPAIFQTIKELSTSNKSISLDDLTNKFLSENILPEGFPNKPTWKLGVLPTTKTGRGIIFSKVILWLTVFAAGLLFGIIFILLIKNFQSA